MENNKLNLWVFWYNSCVWESSSFPMSYHRTRKGAVEAMKTHKAMAKKEHDENNSRMKEYDAMAGHKHFPLKFGVHESWMVKEFELEILP